MHSKLGRHEMYCLNRDIHFSDDREEGILEHESSVTGIFLPEPVGWAWTSPCFKDLQHWEQKGVVPPNLSSFSKKICMYGHIARKTTCPCLGRMVIPYNLERKRPSLRGS